MKKKLNISPDNKKTRAFFGTLIKMGNKEGRVNNASYKKAGVAPKFEDRLKEFGQFKENLKKKALKKKME